LVTTLSAQNEIIPDSEEEFITEHYGGIQKSKTNLLPNTRSHIQDGMFMK
jgi:hypothetical protein